MRSYIHKKIVFFITISLAFTLIVKAQSYGLDIGLSGGAGDLDDLFYHLGGTVGHCEGDRDYVYAGAIFHFYSTGEADASSFETESIISFSFLGGYRFLFPLSRKNVNTSDERIAGVFSEVRGYFNPNLPRRFSYVNTQGELIDLKAKHMTQLALGAALGYYIERKSSYSYFAIRIEYNNLSIFRALKSLDFDDLTYLPSAPLFNLSITLFTW